MDFNISKYLKIGTWNLCLGLANKKDSVIDLLATHEINICALQETEIPIGFPENVLNCGSESLHYSLSGKVFT